ncbi:TPA: glycosyltransferase [Yersinia enterocolitica]|nr:glycosyltransferase [Yersinia enterocolitica]HDY4931234.1 glycosyltransferase [Yersinia enterocolitica]HEC1636096.1 glycosyltransferase [Yersinia enterocolitica]HED0388504.1 glycosyltransferase [Yersinia enterocolitica]
MKILYIITGLGLGGAEKQVIQLADEMRLLGHEIVLVSLTGCTKLLPKNNVTVHQLDMRKNIISLMLSIIKLRNIVKELKPDVVHSHMFHANIFSRVLRLVIKFPKLICTAHSCNEGGRLRMFLYRLTDGLATLSTNVSMEAVYNFIAKGASTRNRMIVVYNGIDTDLFKFSIEERNSVREELNITENSHIILSVGRFTEAKDYPNLLEMFTLLLNKYNHDVEPILYIAGDGDLLPSMKEYATELGISDRVVFLGVRDDIHRLMCAADIFVLSSQWEGFALVVAEAMACELLVVATDCGGVREVVGGLGGLAPIKDPEYLAYKTNKLLKMQSDEKEQREKKGRKTIVENYSLKKAVDRWLAIYKNSR